MELRDTWLDKAHFERFLEKNAAEIDGAEGRLAQRDGTESNFGFHVSLSILYLEKLYAMYSIGYPVEEIKPVYSTWLYHRS
jgi:hypothetical protein